MSSTIRTRLFIGASIVVGVAIAILLVSARSTTDVDEFGSLVARAGGVEQPGVLVSAEPCEVVPGTDDCKEVVHPVTRRVGREDPPSVSLVAEPGGRIEIDAPGRAAELTAYIGRYTATTDTPIGDGDTSVASFERVSTGRVEDVPRRWFVEVPDDVSQDADLLLLRFDHARSVEAPFPTENGDAGEDQLNIGWYEVRIRPGG